MKRHRGTPVPPFCGISRGFPQGFPIFTFDVYQQFFPQAVENSAVLKSPEGEFSTGLGKTRWKTRTGPRDFPSGAGFRAPETTENRISRPGMLWKTHWKPIPRTRRSAPLHEASDSGPRIGRGRESRAPRDSEFTENGRQSRGQALPGRIFSRKGRGTAARSFPKGSLSTVRIRTCSGKRAVPIRPGSLRALLPESFRFPRDFQSPAARAFG